MSWPFPVFGKYLPNHHNSMTHPEGTPPILRVAGEIGPWPQGDLRTERGLLETIEGPEKGGFPAWTSGS